MHPKSTFLVSRTFIFDAAHWLPDYQGPCAQLHGHRYELTVTYQAVQGDDGISLDFSRLKEVVTTLIEDLDHSCLNDRIKNPTAENILLDIYYKLVGWFKMPWLHSLTLKEGRDTQVTLLREHVDYVGGAEDD